MKKKSLLYLVLLVIGNASALLAQAQPVNTESESTKFQDYFYESLKQKGIENYDKAIVSLKQCLKIAPENATVHFELGKNYLALKQYRDAYFSFEQAAKIDPTNKWFFVGMYDVDYATKDFRNGIITVNKLITFDPKFKEDLTSLYMNTEQFDKALALINELNETVGSTDRRDNYKMQILSQPKYQSSEIENLEALIAKYPKEEANYTALIYLYSKVDDIAKVEATVKKLEKEIPESEWAQVSLFKMYLDQDNGPKVVKAVHTVLASMQIDNKIKHRIMNEFLLYVDKNPQYSAELDKAINYFDHDKEINVAFEIAKFYHNKKEWVKAIAMYEKANTKSEVAQVDVNILLLQAYTENKEFKKVMETAEELLSLFPSQPQFYYYAGLGYNQLTQFKKAKDVLESGIDFLIDNKPLEVNFNIQLGEAYNGLGDVKKKEFYFNKANELLKK